MQLNRSGQLDTDLPQYSVNAGLTKLVGSHFEPYSSFCLLADFLFNINICNCKIL